MAATPHKHAVHWALDVSMSEFGSPFSAASSASEFSSTTVQYLNSQLVAHGFAPSPGLCLDGLAAHDTERVVKCLLGMLGQRMEDMNRTEDLSTKYRTLSYDHERLLSMHRTAKEEAANAEREMNVFKSQLTGAQRNLQSSENAHKHTTAELTRTRSAMHALRQTHQADIKKRETQMERMQERWSKLSDIQGQLGKAGSGLTFKCGNASVVEGHSNIGGTSKTFIEVALEQAEETRARLDADNLRLRRMVVNSVNEMQALLHRLRGEDEDESDLHTVSSLFPLHPKVAASDKLSSLLTSFEKAVADSSSYSTTPSTPQVASSSSHLEDEIKHLNNIINKLRSELDQAREESQASAAKTQELFDQLASPNDVKRDIGEISMDLMTASAKDAELERLEAMKQDLDEERQKFSEAAIKLGKERAVMEVERLQFLEEKRAWQVEKILTDLPPTPQPSTSAPKKSSSSHKPAKSPRKSPAKAASSSPRKTRMARRSSVGLTPPPKKGKGKVVELAAETEVIPPLQSMLAPPLGPSLLPTSFVLPPPSPNALLPIAPAIVPAPLEPMIIVSPDMPPDSQDPSSSSSNPSLKTPPQDGQPFASPQTATFPYPVAKPFATRMIHAYSPAKPSPLSRILMLADSPGSPDGQLGSGSESTGQLGVVMEEEEEEELFPKVEAPLMMMEIQAPQQQPMSLAAELGVSESNSEDGRESPFRDMQVDEVQPKSKSSCHPPPVSRTTAKAKNTVTAQAAKTTSARKIVEKEKENKTAESSKARMKDKKRAPPTAEPERPTKVVKMTKSTTSSSRTASESKSTSKPTTSTSAKAHEAGRPSTSSSTSKAGPPPAGRGTGGPRRVLVTSAEAPPLARGRRG